jgi:D-alanyl-D-alanine carboxypeptidase
VGEARPRRAVGGVPFALIAGALLLVLGILVAVRAWPEGFGGGGGPIAATTDPASTGTPPLTSSPSATTPPGTPPAPPACEYGDEPTVFDRFDQWHRTLLDTTFRIDHAYSPPDLASAATAGFREGFMVRSLVVRDLRALGEAAASAGHPVDLIAAYRSYGQQADLFERRVAELGEGEALAKTARPGHSEHQLGTTVDFKDPGALDVTEAWGATPRGTWMRENAWRFGFVESYPAAKRPVTCYGYEPWHYRYLGRALAARVHDSGLTLREYLWAWQELGRPQ